MISLLMLVLPALTVVAAIVVFARTCAYLQEQFGRRDDPADSQG